MNLELFEIDGTDVEFIEEVYLAFLKQNWSEVLRLAWQRFSNDKRYADFVQDGPESLTIVSSALSGFAQRSSLPLAFKSLCVSGAINTSIADIIMGVEKNNIQHYFINAYWLLCKTERAYFIFHEQNDMFSLNGQLLMDRPISDLDTLSFVDKPQTQAAKLVLIKMITNYTIVKRQLVAIREEIKKIRAANQ